MMQILQTATFKKQVKKLHPNQKTALDNAIRAVLKNPSLGTAKKGDLRDIQVYKFNMSNQLTLLAYSCDSNYIQLTLLMLGSHENFYRDLKSALS